MHDNQPTDNQPTDNQQVDDRENENKYSGWSGKNDAPEDTDTNSHSRMEHRRLCVGILMAMQRGDTEGLAHLLEESSVVTLASMSSLALTLMRQKMDGDEDRVEDNLRRLAFMLFDRAGA